MSTILVTGGAGFIGSCFVRMLLADGRHEIVNLDKLTYAGNLDSIASALDDPRHVFVHGDICDRPLVRELFNRHRPQWVVHFAAESHVDRSIDSPGEFVRTNVVGTFELLEAARAYHASLPASEAAAFRFLHVSTDEVFGSLGATGAFNESTPYRPNSPYSASKAGADHLVRAYFHTYRLPVLTTNCSNNYGPYQFPEKLIPLMILNAAEGKPLPVYGDGQNVRDWLYVEDHVRAIHRVLEAGRPGKVYTIGGKSERTNLDVVGQICDLVDRIRPGLSHAPCRKLLTFVPDRPGHDRRYAMDATKIERELSWRPQESFESGLAKTVAWYLSETRWIERVASGVYARERLGLGAKGSST